MSKYIKVNWSNGDAMILNIDRVSSYDSLEGQTVITLEAMGIDMENGSMMGFPVKNSIDEIEAFLTSDNRLLELTAKDEECPEKTDGEGGNIVTLKRR